MEVTDHDTLDSNGDAPLHYLVKRKDGEKFKCLMAFLTYSKCNINMLNVDGLTALHLACQVNSRDTNFPHYKLLFLTINRTKMCKLLKPSLRSM
jgi:ankyrin repeat protein